MGFTARKYGLLVAAVSVTVLAVSCGDSETLTTESRPSATAAVVGSSAESRIANVASASSKFHKQNRMDWVGVEHNRAMDDVRAALRLGPLTAAELCKKLIDVATDESRLPKEHRGRASAAQRLRIAKVALDRGRKSGPCGGSRTASAAGPAVRLASMYSAAESTPEAYSPDALAMFAQIEAAADAANDAEALAASLATIAAAASALSAAEEEGVLAAAAVALASFEYWAAEGPAAAQEFVNVYGPCLSNGTCELPIAMRSEPQAPRSSFMSTTLARCTFSWKGVVRSDIVGAVAGIIFAGITTGGLAAGPAGLAGAIAGSVADFFAEAVMFALCIYFS